jgi:RNA polymerase sigma factor (sigma-70 family)
MATTAASWWRGRPYRERPAETLPEPTGPPGSDDLDGRVEREALWQELATLPARPRAVLVLRYYEGLGEAEIAEVLNVSRGTVKSHAARALVRLRRRLVAGQPDSGAVRS